ncbi:MAG: hypothetical protein Q9M22_07710 [Mariprofundaceae bacterium]|nr:hypothetical protein [Mariprofundaceae bacterium]
MAFLAISKQQSPTYLDDHKKAAADAGLPDDDSNAIVIVTFIFSILLTVASIAQNAMFAISIAQSFAAGMVLVAIYLGFDLGKIVSPALIRLFWMKGNHFFSFFISFGFVAATLASLAAGTSFMATSIEGAQQARVSHSPEAQQNFESQQRLQDEISAMAVNPAAVAHAQREIKRLKALWERAYAKNSAYMTRDYTPKERWFKRTARAVSEDMTPIDNAIAEQQRILLAADDYQGKVAELERVRDLAPTIANGAGELAGFVALGAWAGVPSPRVRVEVLTWTTIFSELLAGIGWLAYGMMKTQKRFSPYELALAQRQATHEQRLVDATFNTIQAQPSNDIQPQPHAASPQQPKSAATPSSQRTEVRAHEPAKKDNENHRVDIMKVYEIPKNGKRDVGKYYPCEDCDSAYLARTTWQKFCSECTAKKKANFQAAAGINS